MARRNALPKLAPNSRLKTGYELILAACEKWSSDDVPRLSAAFSFYAMLSLAPFIVLGAVVAVNVIGTDPSNRYSLMYHVKETLGQPAANLLSHMVESSQKRQGTGVLASFVSFVVMFFSASNLFLELDDAARSIWGTRKRGSFVRLLIMGRLTAFASVIVFGAALIFWLIVDARLAYLAQAATALKIQQLVSFVTSFFVLTLICCGTIKRWASVAVQWRDVWVGGVISAFGLTVSKYLLGLYFAQSGAENVYGPAGALVIILLWIYYSSQIYFFGLEVAYVYAHKHGSLKEKREDLSAMAKEASASG